MFVDRHRCGAHRVDGGRTPFVQGRCSRCGATRSLLFASSLSPEAAACESIDALLGAAGWTIQDYQPAFGPEPVTTLCRAFEQTQPVPTEHPESTE